MPEPHAEAFAKKPASVRSIVVEKTMQPHCNLQDHFEHVPRTSLKKQLQLRVLRSARQSRRRKRAGVRRGIPTYRFRWPERPRREPRRRVVTPFYNNKIALPVVETVRTIVWLSVRTAREASIYCAIGY